MPFCSAIAAISLLAWLASDGCSTVEEWIARIDAMSSSAICDGPSSPIDTPACEPDEAQVRAADRRHPDEVVRPREERRERRRERLPAAADLDADRGGDELLLRDEHLEVAVLVRVAEVLRVRRVRHLAVERHDRAVDRCRAPRATSPYALRVATSSPSSQVGSSPAEVSNVLGSPASGLATSTFRSRSPPSSSIAASGSSSGLPCLPGRSSTALTPLPFFVRAMIAVGLPSVDSASA